MMSVFKDIDGTFSWRKILTCITALVFAVAQLGYLITHNFEKLPDSYWQVDAGVFAFYFLKRVFENVKIGAK